MQPVDFLFLVAVVASKIRFEVETMREAREGRRH